MLRSLVEKLLLWAKYLSDRSSIIMFKQLEPNILLHSLRFAKFTQIHKSRLFDCLTQQLIYFSTLIYFHY